MDGFTQRPFIKREHLRKTSEKDLKRFSDWLNLKTEGYSHRQRAKLVYWLLTRRYKIWW